MRLRRPAPFPAATIALTPLIDVIFILLIFFMLASRFDLWNGFGLALGPAQGVAAAGEEADVTKKDERSVVSIILLANNRISLQGRPVSTAELQEIVRDSGKSTTDRSYIYSVSAERGSSVTALVALLEALKAAGAAGIQLDPGAASPARP